MVSVIRIVAGNGLLDGHPNLIAYVERGTARPAAVRALANQMAGFTGTPPPEFAAWLTEQGEQA